MKQRLSSRCDCGNPTAVGADANLGLASQAIGYRRVATAEIGRPLGLTPTWDSRPRLSDIVALRLRKSDGCRADANLGLASQAIGCRRVATAEIRRSLGLTPTWDLRPRLSDVVALRLRKSDGRWG